MPAAAKKAAASQKREKPSSKPSRLGAIRKGRLGSPLRALFYGIEGVGKSTLAADAPSPIFFDVEGGADQLDIARYPWRDGSDGYIPHSLADIYAGIVDLGRNEHPYETLVIDTVDALEPLVWEVVCKYYSGKKSPANKGGKTLSSIEDFDYGKGYIVAVDEWRRLCAQLDRLRAVRRMNIILLGHSHIRTFKNPTDEDYDRFFLRIHSKSAGMLKGWCDVVGFCAFEEHADRLDGEDRARGVSTGRRLIHLTRTATWDAKSRIALPDEVEIDLESPWRPFAEALELAQATSPEKLRALIKTELARLGDVDLSKKVGAAVKRVRDNTADLSKYLVSLKARQPAAAPEEEEE